MNTYRSNLRRLTKVALTAGFAFVLSLSNASAAEELNIYNWGDYINPEVLKRFEEETGIKVNLSVYNSNEEMLAKIQSGATGYDLVLPSVHMHDIMAKLNLLERTDINQYSGFENIDPTFLRAKSDPEGAYCLPYAWGSVGIMYNRKLLGKDVTGWRDLIETAKATGQKISLLDDVREVMGVGLMLNGFSVNSTDIEELQKAADTIIEMKPYIGAFTYSNRPLVVSGDLAAAHHFIGAMIDVFEYPEDLGFVIPEEGATMYQEDICLLKTAPNKENAIRFMEFYTNPEMPALNMAQQTNGTANMKARALTPEHIRDSEEISPPPEVMERLQIFEDIGSTTRLYDRQWTRIKTSD